MPNIVWSRLLLRPSRLDPVKLGVPAVRKRVYILMVERSVLPHGISDTALKELAAEVHGAVICKPTIALKDLLFPNTHTLVKQHLQKSMKVSARCSCSKCKGKVSKGASADLTKKPGREVCCGWRSKHWNFMKQKSMDPTKVLKRMDGLPIVPGLVAPRARHVAAIMLEQNPNHKVINVSQSVGRNSGHSKNLMTLTPHGIYYLPSEHRCLLAEEAMAVMGYPIHRCDISTNTTAELMSIAGNGMHIRAMAAAMVITLALVDKVKFANRLKSVNKKLQNSTMGKKRNME
jgi:site-specific DNA-cytosine methylase